MSSKEKQLSSYLDNFLTESASQDREKWQRVKCCGSSRSFFCPQCLRIVIPKAEWPCTFQDGSFGLPFALHVVLHDRRTSATGLHAVALLEANEKQAKQDNEAFVHTMVEKGNPPRDSSPVLPGHSNEEKTLHCNGFDDIKLFDVEQGESVPEYEHSTEIADGLTCLLFPSPGESVPLSEVAADLKTLVVLDCKWTRSSMRLNPSIARLKKVHLSNPPETSHFWRWHNAGSGMLSTIEAVYFAALEVARQRKWSHAKEKNLIHIMWLFGLQRAVIRRDSLACQKTIPYSAAGKEEQRALRRRDFT